MNPGSAVRLALQRIETRAPTVPVENFVRPFRCTSRATANRNDRGCGLLDDLQVPLYVSRYSE